MLHGIYEAQHTVEQEFDLKLEQSSFDCSMWHFISVSGDSLETRAKQAIAHTYVANQAILEPILLYHA